MTQLTFCYAFSFGMVKVLDPKTRVKRLEPFSIRMILSTVTTGGKPICPMSSC